MTSRWEHSVQLLAAAVQNPSVIEKLLVVAGWAAAVRTAAGSGSHWGCGDLRAPAILRWIVAQWQ